MKRSKCLYFKPIMTKYDCRYMFRAGLSFWLFGSYLGQCATPSYLTSAMFPASSILIHPLGDNLGAAIGQHNAVLTLDGDLVVLGLTLAKVSS